MGEAAGYLATAIQRSPVGDGRSGGSLERVILADGRRLIVKRLCPAEDLTMSLTGDDIGREYLMWSRGVLAELPREVGHAVVDGWLEGDAAVVVMRDLGDTLFRTTSRISRDQCRLVLSSLGAMHQAFLDRPPEDLTPIDASITRFAPNRMRVHSGGSHPLPRRVLRGWEAFEDLVPDEVCEPVFSLLADPQPLVAALCARPCTLIHGDAAIVNMAISEGRLTMIDWSLSAAAPAALDVAWMLTRSSSAMDMSPDEILEEFVRTAGPAADAVAIRLSLLSALVALGWDKALDVTEHPDDAIRQREWDDLAWWVREARVTLDAGLF